MSSRSASDRASPSPSPSPSFSHSRSRSHSGDESDSSSVVYQHEPFDKFRTRVRHLALSIIWPGATADEITIERLAGGGFNRVIGLTRQRHLENHDHTELGAEPDSETAASSKTEYILRIPRFAAAQVNDEVATLQFLQTYTKIPAPMVITFDSTTDNCLESPYCVQNRVPGSDLLSSFPTLDYQARCAVARELGSIFRQMLDVRSGIAGRFVFSAHRPNGTLRGPTGIDLPLYVAPLQWTDSNQLATSTTAPIRRVSSATLGECYPAEPICKFLTSIFHAQKVRDLERCPTDTVGPSLMDSFCQMARELEARGWLLGDDHYSLAHLDLAPRNILVNLPPTSMDPGQGQVQSSIISGILDWDGAVLAPMFMTCAPPLWIWAWQDDDEEDERTANDDPPTPEARRLKQLFEEAAGPDYVRLAYEPAYRLARRLVRFAIEGVRSNEDFREAKAMLQEWASISHRSYIKATNRGVSQVCP